MTTMVREITEMVTVLPETEQSLAYEFMKRLVLAWDPEFTKLTANERRDLDEAMVEYDRGETINFNDVDWG